MMERENVSKRMRGLLAAGLWTFALTVCPLYAEAALPTHPLPTSPAGAGTGYAGKVESGIRTRVDRTEKTESSRTAEPVNPPFNGSGYTEAEIREQIQRKYTQPRPEFRLVSGAFAGSGYRPGTLDVKIPTMFFPPDVMQDVSETFLENPDGTFGTRPREDRGRETSSYSPEPQNQLDEQEGRKNGAVSSPVKNKSTVQKGITPVKPKQKTITVQVQVPAPSPFRPLAKGDFYWYSNHKGHYVTALPGSLPRDPLLKVPASGPMLIRDAGEHEFMAVTVDDPADTYYYKNQDTFPSYGKTVPVFTETRKNIQNDDVSIKYIRRYVDGQHCLIVDSAGKRAGKTYRVAVVFPENKQYEYLPKALYIIENLRGI